MPPIRVAFAELPRMLRDILRVSLESERDIEVVGEAEDLTGLKALLERHEVDVVMLGLAGSALEPAHYEIFDVKARVRILAIANHGKHCSLYQLTPHRTVLGQGSPQELIAMVREHVRAGGGWQVALHSPESF